MDSENSGPIPKRPGYIYITNACTTQANRTFVVKHTFVKFDYIIIKFAKIVVKFKQTLINVCHMW